MTTILAAGQQIADRYRLEHRIAVGGMGEVWEANDIRLGRAVAVKVLRAELGDDPEFLQRFRTEARTVASLDHPGIAGVHDYGEDDAAGGRRTAYLIMELIRGEPLSTTISHGPIEIDETLRLLEESAWALQAAHERGFVHRDVKPGNILVRDDGVVKLTDFGIAKAADAAPVTRAGMVMGTAHYIAPEQASGQEAGPESDVYSLGIVGYECLTGQRPFRADSAVAVAMMQVREPPPPLPNNIPGPVRELIAASLVKDPTQRYRNGQEFAEAIASVRRGRSHAPASAMTGLFTQQPSSKPINRVGPNTHSGPPQPPPPSAPISRRAPAVSPPAPQRRPAQQPASGVTRAVRPLTSTTSRPVRRPSGAYRLQPRSSSRSLMLVLFLLLTLAAILVGVLLLRSGAPALGSGMPGLLGTATGTVTGPEGVPAGPAVPGGLFNLVIGSGSGR